MEKIVKLQFDKEQYKSLAIKHAEQKDYLGALGFFISALKQDGEDISTLSDIADIYGEMEQIELSNKYWFKYINKASNEEKSLGYEQLAINFFYLDNLYATNFYLNKKIKQDGYLQREKFEQEIPEFFEHGFDKRSMYHIAYPFDRADFSAREKLAKKAMSCGDFVVASMLYESIPEECRNEEIDGEFSVSKLVSNDSKKAIEIANNSLLRHGENITAYCNLSNAYRSMGDKEKSKYYYQKALEYRDKIKDGKYEIITCAIEEMDNETANSCLKDIVEERPYDDLMIFFYGISFLNLGNFESAKEQFDRAYKINFNNKINLFFLKYAQNLIEVGYDNKGYLPIEYKRNLPSVLEKKYISIINKILKDNIFPKRKDINEIIDILDWGIRYSEDRIAKKCVFLLSVVDKAGCEKKYIEYAIDNEIDEEVKGAIIYSLILQGRKEKFGVVVKGIYTLVKPRRFPFEKKEKEIIYLPAYALCMTKAVLYHIEDLDKIGFSINKIYKEKDSKVEKEQLNTEELCCLIMKNSGLLQFSNLEEVAGAFGVDKKRINILSKIIGGDSNENN